MNVAAAGLRDSLSLCVLHPTLLSSMNTVLLQGGQRKGGPVQGLVPPQQVWQQSRAAATGQHAPLAADVPARDAPVLESVHAAHALQQPAPAMAPPRPRLPMQLAASSRSSQFPQQPGPGQWRPPPSMEVIPVGAGHAQGLHGSSQARPGQAQMPGGEAFATGQSQLASQGWAGLRMEVAERPGAGLGGGRRGYAGQQAPGQVSGKALWLHGNSPDLDQLLQASACIAKLQSNPPHFCWNRLHDLIGLLLHCEITTHHPEDVWELKSAACSFLQHRSGGAARLAS